MGRFGTESKNIVDLIDTPHMILRFLAFFGFQLIGGLLGGYAGYKLHVEHAEILGIIAGASFWLTLDVSRASKLLRWLRSAEPVDAFKLTGLWGDIASRTRRLLRNRDRVIFEGENRLQDFLSALQASPNGVVLLDHQVRIEWCNQTAASHFGLDSQRDLLQIFGNLVRDPGFAGYLASRNFGSQLLMPGRNSTSTRPVKLSVQLYPYGGGRLLLLSHDVTAVEQAEAMRRDFVANVSHEIRTPLTVLAGFVETLQTLQLNPEERARYLDLMAQQSNRMQTLVSDLLTLSRLEGSPTPGIEDWIPMSTLMRQLHQDALALTQVLNPESLQMHRLLFECQFDGQIAGIAHELHSAMSNLVSNAIRYTPPGGCIDVRAKTLSDGRVEFSVTDTGPGIAAEHIPRLTERFYRVDRSRSRETGGTGLGLAIVKHVAQRHDAELTIDSIVGKGATFRIIFPGYRLKRSSLVS